MDTDDDVFDMAAHVPTTAEDVAVLRRLRMETPGWFSLTLDELLALLPGDALDRRPPTSPAARPFVLTDKDV